MAARRRKKPAGRATVRATGDKAFGARLGQLRRHRGLTQAELAKKAGIEQPAISDYEQGRRRLHGQAIVDLCRSLAVTADELLGLKDAGGDSNGFAVRRRFLKRLRHVDRLTERQQRALLQTIDAFLAQAQLQESSSMSEKTSQAMPVAR
jgi:transcriptional regulator with XRE-family HTH domain